MTVYSVDVQVTAPVRETEVTDRVADAITNLFPEVEVEHQHGELVATAHNMEHFSERLHEQEILDTARRAFFEDLRGNRFTISLKKQAAFQDVVNFAVGEPGELGVIHVRVRVESPDVERYIDHVAPPTEEGRPVRLDE